MMSFKPPTLQRQNGMTLLELLVATAILSIISVMAFLSMDSLTTAKAGMEAATSRINENRLALSLFSQDIKMAISSGTQVTSNTKDAFIGKSNLVRIQRFNPNQSVPTRFTTKAHKPSQNIVLEVRWMVRDGNWYRATRSALSSEFASWQEHLMMPLEQMRCQYRNRGGQLLNRWPMEGEQGIQIPQAVVCRLRTMVGRQSELLITPWQSIW